MNSHSNLETKAEVLEYPSGKRRTEPRAKVVRITARSLADAGIYRFGAGSREKIQFKFNATSPGEPQSRPSDDYTREKSLRVPKRKTNMSDETRSKADSELKSIQVDISPVESRGIDQRAETMPDDKDYIDAKMEAQEHRLKSDIDRVESKLSSEVSAVRSEMTAGFARVDAELKVISGHLVHLPTKSASLTTAVILGISIVGITLSILAVMGNRFDAGIGLAPVVQQVQENKAENEAQGRKLDAILEVLEVIRDREE